MKTGAASSSGVFYEAFCGDAAKYEAHLAMHEAALRAMKQSLTASFHHFFDKKNGGERVNFQPLNAKLKNRYFTLNYPQLWHFIAHHLQSPEINKTGKKWGMPHSMVEKVEKSIVCLSANLQTGNQTIIPADLKTVKYSMEQQIFNSYGEELGIFSGIK